MYYYNIQYSPLRRDPTGCVHDVQQNQSNGQLRRWDRKSDQHFRETRFIRRSQTSQPHRWVYCERRTE